jgi:hypothetical protein
MALYDSRIDTLEHIEAVRGRMYRIIGELLLRLTYHDESKLQEPEKSLFDKYTPLLRDTTYGSEQYKKYLEEMGSALTHHYENNTHHPEHYPDGVNGMSLFDVLEMLADWKAAGMRHADGSLKKSLEINRNRFGISDQLFRIIENTVRELGW